MSKFTGRTAVVTGAGSGIGRALAYQLAKEGAKLAISDVDEVGLAETAAHARSLGATVRTDRLNVVDRTAVLAYADSVAAEFGGVHLVVNNAGIAHSGDIVDMTFDEIEKVVDVDFWGVVNGTKAFLPHLIASGDGTVVNISSLFGLISMPSQAAYNAAKYAVRGFTEALRIEMLVSGHPVKVVCVHPGGIKTAIARNASVSAGLDAVELAKSFDTKLAKMPPEKAASIILKGAEAGRPRVIVGMDAWALHLLGMIGGTAYQRIVALGAKRVMPSPAATSAPTTNINGRSKASA